MPKRSVHRYKTSWLLRHVIILWGKKLDTRVCRLKYHTLNTQAVTRRVLTTPLVLRLEIQQISATEQNYITRLNTNVAFIYLNCRYRGKVLIFVDEMHFQQLRSWHENVSLEVRAVFTSTRFKLEITKMSGRHDIQKLRRLRVTHTFSILLEMDCSDDDPCLEPGLGGGGGVSSTGVGTGLLSLAWFLSFKLSQTLSGLSNTINHATPLPHLCPIWLTFPRQKLMEILQTNLFWIVLLK